MMIVNRKDQAITLNNYEIYLSSNLINFPIQEGIVDLKIDKYSQTEYRIIGTVIYIYNYINIII